MAEVKLVLHKQYLGDNLVLQCTTNSASVSVVMDALETKTLMESLRQAYQEVFENLPHCRTMTVKDK